MFQGGVKAAAKMLAGLSKAAREKVLETISKKDPRMAEALHKSMYTFDDLEYLTPMMVIELLRSINIKDLGLGLRIANPNVKNAILPNCPKLLRQELEEVLRGELVLNKNANDTLV
jgi:flagellar motor switch protein FliG